jgi:hypothetical protein
MIQCVSRTILANVTTLRYLRLLPKTPQRLITFLITTFRKVSIYW